MLGPIIQIEMKYCILCKENEADKKGSHIVPHFLLKAIVNQEGKSGRDKELGFNIQEFQTESYFGRGVLPEKLDDIYGELSDEDLDKNVDPFVVDYIFCSSCESRLATIESEYSKTIKQPINKKCESGASYELGLLFWMSVLWRMSINGKSGVKFTKNENETLRRILNRILAENFNEIDFESMRNSKDLKKINYKLFRCQDYSLENPTFLLLHPEYRNPYALIIDEIVLLFSFRNNYNDFLQKDLFGLKKEVFTAPTSQFNIQEKISMIQPDDFSLFNKGIIDTMKTIRVKWINEFLDKLHVALNGIGPKMPEQIRSEVFQEITSDEKKLGRKFTIEDLNKSTKKVLEKYGPKIK
jgi:hypothetical protein